MLQKQTCVLVMALLLIIQAAFGTTSQTLVSNPNTANTQLIQCEQNLSICYQQIRELNNELKECETNYIKYKQLYENKDANVKNIEIIRIEQNITTLDQKIQNIELNLSRIENSITKIYDIHSIFTISIGSLIGITLFEVFSFIWEEIRHRRQNGKEGATRGKRHVMHKRRK